jgi:poly(3-hydroxyalkanoate) synthetase
MTPTPQTTRPISVDSLLTLMGSTPADNHEGHQSAVALVSNLAGSYTRALFQTRRMLDAISLYPLAWGPWALGAAWQSQLLKYSFIDPVRLWAKISVSTGRNPDVYAEQNDRIEATYAGLLANFCGFFIENECFDREKARRVATSPEGIAWLQAVVQDFAWLERAYNSRGLTGLMALKDLLKCLLMLVTETPLQNEPLPFRKADHADPTPYDFSDYLDQLQIRFENLYAEKAFDYRAYGEITTQGKLGYSPYETVARSRHHAVTLRHYPLPPGIAPNGKVLYMNTPLINKPEIFDLGPGKSVIAGMLEEGFAVYLVDYGNPGPEETNLGLAFYGKEIHDRYLDLITQRHPASEICAMCYCMGGTLFLPYLARRVQERWAQGKEMDILKVVLMASPFNFDDAESGMGPMRTVIRRHYDRELMDELFGAVNIPPQVIEAGMQEIQPGVRYSVPFGFFARALRREALQDSAPFLYWLTHGTRFPARAHREWLQNVYLDNQIARNKFCLPSTVAELDGQPVDLNALVAAGVSSFDYRGSRDPITPPGSCLNSILDPDQTCGLHTATRSGLNRTIEKNIGHIFVVSRQLLAEYLEMVKAFFREAPAG